MHVDPSASNATVTGAIRQAAQITGTDFQYLVATAQVESNLNPNAKVATSSARGLFQFIEQTWLQTLKQQGAALGYGPYADAISRLPSGKYAVTEPRLHSAIMKLRSDPTASAVMAGAFTRANAARLADKLGRAPAEGELYIAHFLGSTGASRLITLAQSQPTAPAAAAFPGAAKANRSIFYDRQGHARSASEVYRALTGRYQVARDGRTAPAVAATVVAANDVPARRPALDASRTGLADPHVTALRVTSPAVAAKEVPERRRAMALDRVALAETHPTTAQATSPTVAAREAPERRRVMALDRVALADTYPIAAKTALPAVAAKDAPERGRAVALDRITLADTYPVEVRSPSSAVAGKAAPERRRAIVVDAAAAGATNQPAARAPSPAARAAGTAPIFHGLFRSAGANEPVAPLVSALWTEPAHAPLPRPAVAQRATADPASGALDLFQDLPPNARALFRGRG